LYQIPGKYGLQQSYVSSFPYMAVRMNDILQFCDIWCQKLAKNTLLFMTGKAIARHVLIS
ncbi:hypothetical protein ACUC97_29805, partial [Escherichia coli]